MATCSTPGLAIGVNYITIAIPFLITATLIIHASRDKILGGLINKPEYQLATAYILNGVYAVTIMTTLAILTLFLLGPIIFPPNLAGCVSPIANLIV